MELLQKFMTYLRLLYARVGTPFCPHCNLPISASTAEQIVDNIMIWFGEGTKVVIFSPLLLEVKRENKKNFLIVLKKVAPLGG